MYESNTQLIIGITQKSGGGIINKYDTHGKTLGGVLHSSFKSVIAILLSEFSSPVGTNSVSDLKKNVNVIRSKTLYIGFSYLVKKVT